MRRRVLTVLLAGMLAVLGIVAVLAYVRGADQRAMNGLKAETVLVAAHSIPAGTSAGAAITDRQLVARKFPVNSLPADAVRSGSLTHAQTKLVTSSALGAGQVLLTSMLVPKSQGVTSLGIPDGKLAVSIQVCLSADVAGYVQAGAKVAVFNTVGTQFSCTSHQAAGKGTVATNVVLSGITVLSVLPASTSQSGSTSSGAFSGSTGSASNTVTSQGLVLVTLAVNQAQAQTLINWANSGELTLALLTSSSQVNVTGSTSSTPSKP